MLKCACVFTLMLGASLPLFAQPNGTVVGSPVFGPAKFGNGLILTNDSNYISLPANVLSITTSSSWTMEAWLKTTTSSVGVAASMGTGVYSNTWMGVYRGHFAASIYGSGGFAGGSIVDSGIPINDGNWHHCVMEMSGGSTLSTYVDGVPGNSGHGTAVAISTPGAIGTFSGTLGILLGRICRRGCTVERGQVQRKFHSPDGTLYGNRGQSSDNLPFTGGWDGRGKQWRPTTPGGDCAKFLGHSLQPLQLGGDGQFREYDQ